VRAERSNVPALVESGVVSGKEDFDDIIRTEKGLPSKEMKVDSSLGYR